MKVFSHDTPEATVPEAPAGSSGGLRARSAGAAVRVRGVRAERAPAFTLLELLAVIAVVAILTAILLPVVGSMRNAAASAKTASNLRQLMNATKLWSQDNDGLMPDSKWYASRSKLRAGSDFEKNWSLHPYVEIPRNRRGEKGPTAFTCIASDQIIRGHGRYRRSVSINHYTGIREGVTMSAGPVRMAHVEEPAKMMLYASGIVVGGGYRSSVHVGLDTEAFLYPYDGKNMIAYVDGSVDPMSREEFETKMEENFRQSPFWVGTYR